MIATALLGASTLEAQRTEPLADAGGRIGFQIAEQLDSAPAVSSLSISFWSEARYAEEPALLTSVTRRGGAFVLSDWRIAYSEIAMGIAGQATGSVALPFDLGTHELIINRMGIDDRYRVTVDRDVIHVTAVSASRVSVTGDTLIRRAIPNSFAVRCHGASWFCARVFRELALVPGLRPFDMPSAGRNPFGEQITRNDDRQWSPPRYFRYSTMRQVNSARATLRRVRDELRGSESGDGADILLWRERAW